MATCALGLGQMHDELSDQLRAAKTGGSESRSLPLIPADRRKTVYGLLLGPGWQCSAKLLDEDSPLRFAVIEMIESSAPRTPSNGFQTRAWSSAISQHIHESPVSRPIVNDDRSVPIDQLAFYKPQLDLLSHFGRVGSLGPPPPPSEGSEWYSLAPSSPTISMAYKNRPFGGEGSRALE